MRRVRCRPTPSRRSPTRVRAAPRRSPTSSPRSSTARRLVMVPAAVVDATLDALAPPSSRVTSSLTAAIRTITTTSRAPRGSRPSGMHYIDVGTSGGVWGLDRGYCLMIGGETDGRAAPRSDFRHPRAGRRRHRAHAGPRRRGGTTEQGYLHCGPAGAGHFVKMVHNGIEYGMMAAYAEGLNILQPRQRRQAREPKPTPRRRRSATPSTTSTTSISPT